MMGGLMRSRQIIFVKNICKGKEVASLCAQAAEKYLKAVLEVTFAEESLGLLHSLNLRAITNKLKAKYPQLEISSKDMKWLGDFYFDARYPGDNFVEVTREDALECLYLVESLQVTVERLLEELERKKIERKEVIANLTSFDDFS
ncbi:MAG: HEPN domain-containing protein [Lachnospiraceae bacterium]